MIIQRNIFHKLLGIERKPEKLFGMKNLYRNSVVMAVSMERLNK